MNIEKELFNLADQKYATFCGKLAPNLDADSFIGIRVPQLRKFASEIDETQRIQFLNQLPHKYYDENLLHSILLIKEKDYQQLLKYLEAFLPYIDNWAVCDTLRPKAFKKNHKDLIKQVYKWIKSDHEYTVRFAIDTLMSEFLDDDFKEEYLQLVASVRSDKYYINMMISWYFATALAKHYQQTITYLMDNKLDDFCHNKTIQKAIESYRITDQQKEYLRTLKRR